MRQDPPFDGSPACPACPWQIRNLWAVAENLAHGSSDTTMQDLRDACLTAKPLLDAHFADTMHSHGRLPGC